MLQYLVLFGTIFLSLAHATSCADFTKVKTCKVERKTCVWNKTTRKCMEKPPRPCHHKFMRKRQRCMKADHCKWVVSSGTCVDKNAICTDYTKGKVCRAAGCTFEDKKCRDKTCSDMRLTECKANEQCQWKSKLCSDAPVPAPAPVTEVCVGLDRSACLKDPKCDRDPRGGCREVRECPACDQGYFARPKQNPYECDGDCTGTDEACCIPDDPCADPDQTACTADALCAYTGITCAPLCTCTGGTPVAGGTETVVPSEDVTVTVGTSWTNVKTVTADVDTCPSLVDRSNWHEGSRSNKYKVVVSGDNVHVKRTDPWNRETSGWTMDLAFTCTRGGSSAVCPSRGFNMCNKCDAGYYLEDGKCKESVCICEHGTVAKGMDCPIPGEDLCLSCDNGYYLNKGICVKQDKACLLKMYTNFESDGLTATWVDAVPGQLAHILVKNENEYMCSWSDCDAAAWVPKDDVSAISCGFTQCPTNTDLCCKPQTRCQESDCDSPEWGFKGGDIICETGTCPKSDTFCCTFTGARQEVKIEHRTGEILLADVYAYDKDGGPVQAITATLTPNQLSSGSSCIDGNHRTSCNGSGLNQKLTIRYPPSPEIVRVHVENYRDCCKTFIHGATLSVLMGETVQWTSPIKGSSTTYKFRKGHTAEYILWEDKYCGSDIAGVQHPSAKNHGRCERACDADDECNFYTYNGKSCHTFKTCKLATWRTKKVYQKNTRPAPEVSSDTGSSGSASVRRRSGVNPLRFHHCHPASEYELDLFEGGRFTDADIVEYVVESNPTDIFYGTMGWMPSNHLHQEAGLYRNSGIARRTWDTEFDYEGCEILDRQAWVYMKTGHYITTMRKKESDVPSVPRLEWHMNSQTGLRSGISTFDRLDDDWRVKLEPKWRPSWGNVVPAIGIPPNQEMKIIDAKCE